MTHPDIRWAEATGAQRTPSPEEIEAWESYVEQRTDFYMGDEDELDEESARERAIEDAHRKFGFTDDHF